MSSEAKEAVCVCGHSEDERWQPWPTEEGWWWYATYGRPGGLVYCNDKGVWLIMRPPAVRPEAISVVQSRPLVLRKTH